MLCYLRKELSVKKQANVFLDISLLLYHDGESSRPAVSLDLIPVKKNVAKDVISSPPPIASPPDQSVIQNRPHPEDINIDDLQSVSSST